MRSPIYFGKKKQQQNQQQKLTFKIKTKDVKSFTNPQSNVLGFMTQ